MSRSIRNLSPKAAQFLTSRSRSLVNPIKVSIARGVAWIQFHVSPSCEDNFLGYAIARLGAA